MLRYQLVESTRVYATERLVEAGDRERLAGRHLQYLRDRFAKLRERQEATARSGDMIAAFLTEIEDLRFALDGALARPDRVDAAELLVALERVSLNGFNVEGFARHEAFVAVLSDE